MRAGELFSSIGCRGRRSSLDVFVEALSMDEVATAADVERAFDIIDAEISFLLCRTDGESSGGVEPAVDEGIFFSDENFVSK